MTPSIDSADLDQLLARHYFGRTRLSSLSALLPLGLMVGPEFAASRPMPACLWLAAMMLILTARADELTQIPNRRGVLEILNSELATSSRHALPLAVLMADIDHFKSINDTHGHAAGDEALRIVARTLAEALREGDSVGRLGGEEFLVLLPMLEGEGAQLAAERLRLQVEQARAAFEGRGISLSVSIGVGCRRQGDSLDSLLARADTALYAAKGAGRNRVAMELPG